MNKLKDILKTHYKYPAFIITSLVSYAYYVDGLDYLTREANIYIAGMIGILAFGFGGVIIYRFILWIIGMFKKGMVKC